MGYHTHELGDACLILRGRSSDRTDTPGRALALSPMPVQDDPMGGAVVRRAAPIGVLFMLGVASTALAEDSGYPILQDSLLVPEDWQGQASAMEAPRAVDDPLLDPGDWRTSMALAEIAVRAVDDTLLDPFITLRVFLADPWAGWTRAQERECDCECASLLVPSDWSK